MTHGPIPDELLEGIGDIPRGMKAALWLPLAAILLTCSLGVRSCVGRRQVDAHVQQADTHHQAAVVAAAQAEVYDAQVTKEQAQVKQHDSEVASVDQEVAGRRAHVAEVRRGLDAPAAGEPAGHSVDPGQGVGAPVDQAELVAQLKATVSALDDLVASQDAQHQQDLQRIADRDALISTISLSRDAWRLSAQASAAEAVQLRAALAAQQGLIEGALLKGRIQGFSVGLGSGYLAGRVQR